MKYRLPLAFAQAPINLLAFVAVTHQLGGDAINGRVVNGHYFLGSHGRLTEVSASVFAYSQWHAMSLFLTFPLGLLAGAWCVFTVMDEMTAWK